MESRPVVTSPETKQSMHILLIHQSFASLWEAGGTRHHEFVRYLASQGHRITIITSSISYLSGQAQHTTSWITREQDGPNITILRTYAYPALHRSFFHRVLSFISFMVTSFIAGLRTQQVDLVWGTSPPIFQGFSAWLLAKVKHVPFLFEVRDLWPAFAIAVGVLRNPILIRASFWLEKYLYRHSDRIMVNSPGFIQHVVDRGARWVEIIPNGADPGMFMPDNAGMSFRQKYHLDNNFIAIYAGAHGLSNDLEVVIQAANFLKDRTDISVIFLGDGKEKAALIQKAHDMQLPNVHFLPSLPKSEMAEALAAADACIAILKPIPLYATTYPNKVFDYMAAGRPVILAIDGVIRKVIEDTKSGIFVPPGDPEAMAKALVQLAELPDRGRSMGRNGRTTIEKWFSREKLAEKLISLLEEMRSMHG